MEMKSKLYKHHIAKTTILARRFSIAFISCFLFVSVVAIPTYISVHSHKNISLKASEVSENVEERNNNESEKDLLSAVTEEESV